MADDSRVKTGIPGFDELIQGGFVKNSINLISGGPGTGKSIFAMQFLYNGATKFKEKGIYFSCEERVEELKADAKNLGMDIEKLEKEGKIKFIYFSPYAIGDLLNKIEIEVDKLDAKRVVLDSTSVLGLSMKSLHDIRQSLYDLTKHLKILNTTSVLTAEADNSSSEDQRSSNISRFGVEEYVADSITVLHYLGLGGSDDRSIRIIKMRRTNHISGPQSMQITDQGITITKNG